MGIMVDEGMGCVVLDVAVRVCVHAWMNVNYG